MTVYPKDPRENLLWRAELRRMANNNPAVQQRLIDQCREDPLFFCHFACWLHEPRRRFDKDGNRLPSIIPFVTWDHQDEIILDICDCINRGRDMGMEKSRGEGATWMVLTEILRQWLLDDDFLSFGIMSRNEKMADNTDDPNSLGYKLDFQLAMLPIWMTQNIRSEDYVPGLEHSIDFRRIQSKHTWTNEKTRSTITAYSTTGDVARGGRATAVFVDEFGAFERGEDEAVMASLGEVTDCTVMVSTPQGPTGAYYKAMREHNPLMKKVRIHWTDNQSRNRGLYYIDAETGMMKEVDPVNNPLPAGYREEFAEKIKPALLDRGYDIEKGMRSPWYDERCLRPRMTPKKAAQEYDIDYGGAKSRFFPVAMLERLQKTTRAPLVQGEVDYTHEKVKPKWRPKEEGRLLLWMELTAEDKPPRGVKYVIGADLSTGQGGEQGSNSALSIIERDTGKKVGEFATPTMPPEEFAYQTVAMCRFFNNAYLIWEDNGPGKPFRNQVFKIGYRNFYYRSVTEKVSNEKSTKPGWTTQKGSKRELLSNYSYALGSGEFENPSHVALEEAKGYQELPNGKIEHTASQEADPSGAGENHGDRVIADALAYHAASEFEVKSEQDLSKEEIANAPERSFAGRRNAAEAKRREENRIKTTSEGWKTRLAAGKRKSRKGFGEWAR